MIIKIKKFGPIKEFEIDLSKDFSIIYGKNNIGKSYAVSVIYLILKKHISKEKNYNTFINDVITMSKIQEHFEKVKKNYRIIIENWENNIDTLKKNELESLQKFKASIEGIKEILASCSEKEDIEKARYFFQKEFIDELQKSFIATFGDGISNESSNDKTEVYINTNIAKIILCKIDDKFINFEFKCLENEKFLDSEIDKVYYFPASRIGVYQSLSSLSPIFAELSKSRGSIKKSFEIPSIPEPVSDYFLALSSIKKGVTDRNNPIVLLAEEIEQTVLGGEVIFDDDTKKMIYKPYKTDLYLDMFQVSSMAAEISPLVLFLKYIIAPSHNKTESKSLLFIEEPEAHLHPETQIKLMEIFAKLVKHNIKIIITSHSDFMFNKMNNLILEKKLDISKSCAIILEASEHGSISKVLPMDDLGVEDENFLATTEYLFNERTDLIDKLNQDS